MVGLVKDHRGVRPIDGNTLGLVKDHRDIRSTNGNTPFIVEDNRGIRPTDGNTPVPVKDHRGIRPSDRQTNSSLLESPSQAMGSESLIRTARSISLKWQQNLHLFG